jgi:hypothetical protein
VGPIITDPTSGVSLTFTLEGERVELSDVIATLQDIQGLLADIERQVRNVPRASVKWTWAEESPQLELVATVNGVGKDDLTRIVADARQGFLNAELAAEDHQRVEWPESFGSKAQRSARNILRRLERLEAITVRAESLPPVTIDSAEISEFVTGRKSRQRLIHSSIDGRLDLISRRGRLRATIKEHNTGALVRCSFPDEMIESIKSLFDKRVVAEGLVRYGDDRKPISIRDITSVRERSGGRPLEDFVGVAPKLAGGLSAEDFIARLRGDE